MKQSKPYYGVLIVPTGVGASIGGYAGDALPVARVMAQTCTRLITHPNVMNGASLYWCGDNIDYVEGYALDKFAEGKWGLQPSHQNRIGLILDQGIEEELRHRHLQATEAVRATLGINVSDYIITDAPLAVQLKVSDGGISWGTIGNADSLLRAGEKLVRQGVRALGVVARFPDDTDSQALADYRHGSGVDGLAGAEAVISHLLVREFQIPSAHAPALATLPFDLNVSPRAAAEELGYTFLPCVLAGLSRAPQFITDNDRLGLRALDVDVLVIPHHACGGSATLSFADTKTLIIVVEDNNTVIKVPPEPLGLKAVRVKSYLEAVGVMTAHRSGVNYQALLAGERKINQIF